MLSGSNSVDSGVCHFLSLRKGNSSLFGCHKPSIPLYFVQIQGNSRHTQWKASISLLSQETYCFVFLPSVSAKEQLFELYGKWMVSVFHVFYFVSEHCISDSIFPGLLHASWATLVIPFNELLIKFLPFLCYKKNYFPERAADLASLLLSFLFQVILWLYQSKMQSTCSSLSLLKCYYSNLSYCQGINVNFKGLGNGYIILLFWYKPEVSFPLFFHS